MSCAADGRAALVNGEDCERVVRRHVDMKPHSAEHETEASAPARSRHRAELTVQSEQAKFVATFASPPLYFAFCG